MKKLAKKSRKIVQPKDLTVKQFKQALARNGMELTQDGNLDTISVYGFELVGKTRRAKLANAIARKSEYDAESETGEHEDFNEEGIPVAQRGTVDDDLVIDPQTGLEIHEADYGSDPYQIADTAIGQKIIDSVPTYPLDPLPVHVPTNVVDGMSAPIPLMQPLKAFTSTAVAELFESIAAKRGEVEATKILQGAVRDCGKKTVVDGKLGPYTLKLANKIPEADLLSALASRVQEKLAAEAK
jgi:hypothetical protein